MSNREGIGALALPGRSEAATARLDGVETQVAEQAEVIQSLFDAFKLLTEENVRKEKRLEKVESHNNQLKELIALHLVEGLDVIRKKVEHMDRVEGIIADLDKLKSGMDDVKFVIGGGGTGSGGTATIRDRSPSPNRRLSGGPAPLPFLSEPSIGIRGSGSGVIDKIHASVESVLGGIEYIARQRNADVQSINASLERLDTRIKQLAAAGSAMDTSQPNDVPDRQSVIGYVSSHKNFNALMNEIRSLKDDVIPDLETDWAGKWSGLATKVDQLKDENRRTRDEMHAFQEKSILRDTKLSQLMSSGELSRRHTEKSEVVSLDMNNRVLKLESDVAYVFEEIKRVEDSVGQLVVVESKLDLNRSECKSNWERVARQTKQDVDSLRVKLERIAVVEDEFERVSSEVRNLHDLVVKGDRPMGSTQPSSVMAPQILPRLLAPVTNMPSEAAFSSFSAPPPLVQAAHASSSFDSSVLSVLDEGIGSTMGSNFITAKLSAIATIPVPMGGSEVGALRFDPSTNRILWRIDNVASMLREPSRFAKILVSPEFSATCSQTTLIARMKLFPQGSDQSRVDGSCSFYLRCLPGVVVRYSVDLAGEVMDTFECEYEKQRDKGKHDFVKLNEYTHPDGSVTIGIQLKAVSPMVSGPAN